jgi:hypothetical protein
MSFSGEIGQEVHKIAHQPVKCAHSLFFSPMPKDTNDALFSN